MSEASTARTAAALMRRVGWWLPLVTCCLGALIAHAADRPREYEIKAVLVERFSRFVTWPTEQSTETFTIYVLGDGLFADVLESVYADREILDRPVRVIHAADLADIAGGDVLYVGSAMGSELGAVVAAATKEGVLTVSDTPGFGRAGIMINFYLDRERVRFEINETTVDLAGFTMSYHLLREARILHATGDAP